MSRISSVKPFAYTELAVYLRKRIRELRSRKSQIQIAVEAGWAQSPNMLSMIANGASKMPIERVPALAKALGADTAHLLRLALLQHDKELWNTIERACGMVLTRNEESLLTHIRRMSRHADPSPTPKLLAALREVLER